MDSEKIEGPLGLTFLTMDIAAQVLSINSKFERFFLRKVDFLLDLTYNIYSWFRDFAHLHMFEID